ncbi:FecR family protein [Pedobacter gandavensis]|uniref:FecR family protein n=1 Tax=Pedobacter gandavensis TaxID=2679963 RepID=UPI00292F6243|nr:FecR domain-containing protein [Pedobacter gandavensis]
MNRQEIEALILKYDQGACNEQEKALLETWYASWNIDQMVEISEEALAEDLAFIRKNTFEAIQPSVKSTRLWPKIAVAATVMMTVGAGWFYFAKPERDQKQQNTKTIDVDPGSIGATLTLANGKRIKLGSSSSGTLAKEAGVTITKTANGELIYELTQPVAGAPNKINILSTSNGESYRLRLPDQTEVWLNAASQLKYPVSFTKDQSRQVELIGEAYFQVAKDKNHPFVLKTQEQKITVLGTAFNVKGYVNEPIKTTLVEGSVAVSSPSTSRILKPGQRATLNAKGEFKVGPADKMLDLAWKNNEFMFESESIENVMKMVERWYNVEVVYVGQKSTEKFGGVVSRFEKVSKVLEVLERTGTVKFRISDNTIYVSSITNP